MTGTRKLVALILWSSSIASQNEVEALAPLSRAFTTGRRSGTHNLRLKDSYFTNNGGLSLNRRRKRTTLSSNGNASRLSMYLDFQDVDAALTLATPLLGTSFVVPPSLLTNAAAAATNTASPITVANMIMSDPEIEVEILNDMAHVTLDMAGFFIPATIALRLFAVIGRIFVMGADYIPDHTILSEEFIFQLFMLAIASKGLFNSMLPIAASIFAVTSRRDVRTYLVLFRQTGLTWTQYRAMKALALDWIDVPPGHVITSDEQANVTTRDENFYWLYRGQANIRSNGTHLQTVVQKFEAPRRNGLHSMALLGEMDFALRLDNRKQSNNPRKKNHKSSFATGQCNEESSSSSATSPFSKATISAGPAGATLLRINTSKLIMLMDNDAQLAQSIRCLLMTEMQEKLLFHLAKAQQLDKERP